MSVATATMSALFRFGTNIMRTSSGKCYKLILEKCQPRNSTLVLGSRHVSVTSEEGEVDPRNITEDGWLKRLTPEQYFVCREKGTEEPFTGKYYMHKEEGIYSCTCCGAELFSSKTKYDSGTGWPSFYEPHSGGYKDDENSSNVLLRPDVSLAGLARTEVLCKKCDGHLGHVFKDGPQPTGLRYCINSTSLKFIPKKIPFKS